MMGLRGMYLYPMFIGLACLLGPEWLLIGLLCALQGVIYWLVGLFGERKYSVASSEFLFGLMLDATFITTWGMDVC